ncbi:uncharacterized protein LOC144103482 [Amblyomma americanum]
MSSHGAAIAAVAGRGNRFASDADKDYEIVLPTLPTGRVVLNTVFLHGDLRARPYRVEDFRDALANAGALPDVVALGAYQINHVWAVTFSTADAAKKLAATKELEVKGRRCIVFDPEDHQVKLRLHWMLHGVADEDIRTAFAAFGNVTEVTRERWHVAGMKEKGSTTRTVLLKLKPGVKVDDLPHQVRVAGELALVVVPGRPMQCLRCGGTGHVRRDCKVPRCSKCRRYGHSEADCVRTYASATGHVAASVSAELMDVVEAEEAASGADDTGKAEGVAVQPAVASSNTDTAVAQESGSPATDPSSTPVETPKDGASSSVHVERKAASESHDEKDDSLMNVGVTTPAKRPHAETKADGEKAAEPSVGEPPAKTPQARRAGLRPRPKVPAEKRGGDKAPPDQEHVLTPDDTGGDGIV